MSCATTDAIYSRKGFSNLVVKEARLDNLSTKEKETLRFELNVIISISHPGILRYRQVIEDGGFIYIVMDRYDSTLDKVVVKHTVSP